MPPSDPEPQLTRREQLAAELQRLRLGAGLTGRQLAGLIPISQSKISRMENARLVPTNDQAIAWARATGADADMQAQLLTQVHAALTEFTTWRISLRGKGLPGKQDEIRALEATARAIRNFQPAFVPGLLQTAEYARRVFQLYRTGLERQDYDGAVARRLARQEALHDRTRLFEFVITEAALRWRPGPVTLLALQLDRIASVADFDNVTVGLIPAAVEATAVLPHPFIVYEPAVEGEEDAPRLVRYELLHDEMEIHDPTAVELYVERLDRAREMAVHGDAARRLLAEITADLRRQHG